MRFFFIILFAFSAFAADDEVAKILKSVQDRKAAINIFIEKVSKGDRCPVRDYACFSTEVMAFLEMQSEDMIMAKDVLLPFYERSMKEVFPPCEKSCQAKIREGHIYLSLNVMRSYNTKDLKYYRVPPYPTVSSTRIRAYMDLSAFHRIAEMLVHIENEYKLLDLNLVKNPDPGKDKIYYEKQFKRRKDGVFFNNSILCHLKEGDLVYDEISRGEGSKKKSDQNFAQWLKEFDRIRSVCVDATPMEYKGTDESTRAYYRNLRDKKLAAMKCADNDFGCARKNLRELRIHYAEDVQKISNYLKDFSLKSRPAECDETCEAQLLIRTIQTWVSYLSTYEREKLASTMDWKEHPEARFLTITEDVTMYETLKEVFNPLIAEFGKIDPRKVTDAGLKSEMKSVGKDLSDFSSGRMLKDSVICTMDPWNATYDKYMVPYKNKELDKKFENAFLDFKEAICK